MRFAQLGIIKILLITMFTMVGCGEYETLQNQTNSAIGTEEKRLPNPPPPDDEFTCACEGFTDNPHGALGVPFHCYFNDASPDQCTPAQHHCMYLGAMQDVQTCHWVG